MTRNDSRPSILPVLVPPLLACVLSIAFPIAAQAVPVTFQVTVPSETPAGDPVYIAGDFQGWNPGDPAHRLTESGPLLYEVTLDPAVGTTLQYKFTRGDWGKVEKGPNGEEIPNRVHQVTGEETLELIVASWADLPANSTVTGDVSLISVPGFLGGRRVWVYLPPQYHDEPERRYPVLYMLDGQNVFDQATSFAGEWEVDESCELLIAAEQMAPIIVVAIANGEAGRIDEYTPWHDPDFQGGMGGGGEAHLQAFIDFLIPHIDATYRTLTGPEHTGLAGSSLGGLMSLYAAYAHPETFGRLGALSPSIWWYDQELLAFASAQPKPSSWIYMDMGTLEPGYFLDGDGNGVADAVDELRALRDVMTGQGFVLDEDLMVVEDEGGSHNEAAWAARFPVTLQFLFPVTSTAAPQIGHVGPLVVRPNTPNPFNPSTKLSFELTEPAVVTLQIFDLGGKLMRSLLRAAPRASGLHEMAWNGCDDRGHVVASGTYFYKISAGSVVETRSMTLVR